MTEILSHFRSIDMLNYVGVEDFADRLSYLITPTMLGALCSMVTVRTYFMHPISCFVPNQFGHTGDDGQMSFVNNYCWTEGTYAVKPGDFQLDNSLEDGGLSRYKKQKIVYYQWIPFVLAMQAVLFSLPRLFWHMFSYDRAGTDVAHIVKIARDAAHETGENRDKLVGHASRMLQQMISRNLSSQNTSGQYGSLCSCCRCLYRLVPSRLIGSWLILTYFLVKIAYLGNAIGQLALMQTFLHLDSSRYYLLGINLLADVAVGEDWQNTMVFPRVGCCAVYMRTAGKGNWQFSQCSLPINMINEKIYIFLWFWISAVALITGFSILTWSIRLFNSGIRGSFISRYLKLADNYDQLKRNEHVKKFMRKYLRHDGTFVLKMIALNCGDIVCSDILQSLWGHYKSRCVQRQLNAAESGDQEEQQRGLHRSNGMLRLSCRNLPEIQKRRRSVFNGRPSVTRLIRRISEPPPNMQDVQQHHQQQDQLLRDLQPSAPPSSDKLEEIDEQHVEEEDDINCTDDCEDWGKQGLKKREQKRHSAKEKKGRKGGINLFRK